MMEREKILAAAQEIEDSIVETLTIKFDTMPDGRVLASSPDYPLLHVVGSTKPEAFYLACYLAEEMKTRNAAAPAGK